MEDEDLMKQLEEANAELTSLEAQAEEQKDVVEPKETVDPYLEEAIKNGYNPNYGGPDKKTPEQYVRDGSFFKKISSQKKEINELKDAIRDIARQLHKSERVGYEKAYRELIAEKDSAIELGDAQKVHALDEELDKIKEELRKPEPAQTESPEREVHPAALEFKEKNSTWFGKFDTSRAMTDEEKENLEMTETAMVYDNYLGEQVAKGLANYSPEQCLQMVQERIKKYYPHRFENPKQSEPIAVGKPSSSVGSSTKTSDLISRITDRQRDVHKLMLSVDPDFGSLEEYAKHLEKIGELKN